MDAVAEPPASSQCSQRALGVAELARAYRDGTVTPTDAVEACIAAYTRIDPKVFAWAQPIDVEAARSAAKTATERFASGEGIDDLSQFYGVPFALKDLIDVEGVPTTNGTAARPAKTAVKTAPVAANLIANGGVYMGKLNTVEFAFGGWGTNQHVGAPKSPWSREKALVCGGSSSGSGAAVASGIVPCAVGTDTGGSVRGPAAFCGIVGLKTTKGMLSTDGIHPLSHTLDTPGPLARSVEDCALMCAAMMPVDEGKAFLRASAAVMDAGVEGLKLAVMGDCARALVTDPVQLEAFDSAVETLRSLGAEVTVFDWDVSSNMDTWKVIGSSEAYYHNSEVVDDPTSKMGDVIKKRMLTGKTYSAHDYIAATLLREAETARWLKGMGDRVAWLTPTTGARPIPLEEVDEEKSGLTFTGIANRFSLCAISVPTGPVEASDDGLPTSLQITCNGGDEATALRIARAYERARGPLARPPLYAD